MQMVGRQLSTTTKYFSVTKINFSNFQNLATPRYVNLAILL